MLVGQITNTTPKCNQGGGGRQSSGRGGRPSPWLPTDPCVGTSPPMNIKKGKQDPMKLHLAASGVGFTFLAPALTIVRYCTALLHALLWL